MGVHFRYQQIFLPHWLVVVGEEKSVGEDTILALGASPFASAFDEAIIILSRHAARRLLRTRLLLVLLWVGLPVLFSRCCRRHPPLSSSSDQ